jgi:hypothetical protein
MHDPFLNYATMAAPYGAQPYGTQPYGTQPYGQPGTLNPIGIPYNLQTSGMNPLASIHPLAASALGIQQAYPLQAFINPQVLQLASALAQQAAIPQPFAQHAFGLSPLAGIQNPVAAALLANPFIAAGLQSQYGGQQFGQQQHPLYSQLAQGGLPFIQGGLQGGIGGQLAPQSWVGPGGQAGLQGYGQINPLAALLAARGIQGQGLSPWGY